MSLEEQFAMQEQKRLETEKAKILTLETLKESFKVHKEAETLEKEVLALSEDQRVRAQTKLSELLKFRSDLALTDVELVKLEKQYLSLLNKELKQ